MPKPSTLFASSPWRRGWSAGATAFLLLLALNASGLLRPLENSLQDRLRVRYALPYQSPLEIVYLDDVSLRDAESQFGIKFPWPREVYGNAVDFLRSAGAKAVVFDFLFTSASSYGPDDDASFAAACRRHGTVLAGFQFTDADQPEARARFHALGPRHALLGAPFPGLDQAHGVDTPGEPLWSALAGLGDTHFEQDADGLGRRERLAVSLDGRQYPSLALATAVALGVTPPTQAWAGRQWLLLRRPSAPSQTTRLFDVAASWAKLQAHEAPLVDPARFKGKVVLIGSSAPGLNDLRSSPMGKALPGVELQAMALDNLLTGQRLQVQRCTGTYWLILALLCLAVANFSFRLRGPWVLAPALAVIVANTALAAWCYQSQHLLIPVLWPWAAAVLAFTHGAVENYVEERASRRRVTSVFGQFLSPAVLATLRGRSGQLEMGGETRTLTVYFSDLQGFTSFSEKLSPAALVAILNEYLTAMGEVVVGRFDGTVDKYIGDAVMAFWNAPTEQPDHAWRACAAAWACQQRLAQIQTSLAAQGLDAGEEGLVMRIGLNTGPAVAGLMGSQRKLNYTVMGDTVNTASRLEGANKPYGSRILISQATKDAAGERVLTRPLDYIKVKGKAGATAVFEVIGIAGEPGVLYDSAYVEQWGLALQAYKDGRFSEALGLFQACALARPKDGAGGLFIERCRHYLAEPPQAWDGVFVMKTK